MKRLFAIVVLLAAFTFGQSASNAISSFKTYDNGAAFVVECSYTLDSLAGMASEVFKLPAGGYNFSSTAGVPITFKKKNVSTYGTNPYMSIYLQGVWSTSTDTMSIDTVCNQGQLETDTLGILTTNGWTPPAYKLYFRNLVGDINTGKITLIFPKIYALKPY